MANKIDTIKQKISHAENVRLARESGGMGISETINNADRYVRRKASIATGTLLSSDVSSTDKAKAICNLLIAPAVGAMGISASMAIGITNRLSQTTTTPETSEAENTEEVVKGPGLGS